MASILDFDENEWRDTLAELRMLVVSAGFLEWDAAMAAALEEEEEEAISARWSLIRYTKSFAEFLSVRSGENLDRMQLELGKFLQTENERPVTEAVVSFRGEGTGVSVLTGPPSDRLVEEVMRFAHALQEETGYFDGPESDR